MRAGHWLGLVIGLSCWIASPGFGQIIGGPAVPTDAGELAAGGNATVLADVPSYIWYHGCGPTAIGMIIGYWDAHGFGNLIPGSNDWDANRQAIKDAIASPGHIYDYVPTPDRVPTPEDPYHADDCIADFCGCSRNPLEHGWSCFSKQDDGFRDYAEYCGYAGSIAQNVYYSSLWDSFVAAIDAGEPVEFLVDTDGSGGTDHFIAAIGYDDTPGQPCTPERSLRQCRSRRCYCR